MERLGLNVGQFISCYYKECPSIPGFVASGVMAARGQACSANSVCFGTHLCLLANIGHHYFGIAEPPDICTDTAVESLYIAMSIPFFVVDPLSARATNPLHPVFRTAQTSIYS